MNARVLRGFDTVWGFVAAAICKSIILIRYIWAQHASCCFVSHSSVLFGVRDPCLVLTWCRRLQTEDVQSAGESFSFSARSMLIPSQVRETSKLMRETYDEQRLW